MRGTTPNTSVKRTFLMQEETKDMLLKMEKKDDVPFL